LRAWITAIIQRIEELSFHNQFIGEMGYKIHQKLE